MKNRRQFLGSLPLLVAAPLLWVPRKASAAYGQSIIVQEVISSANQNAVKLLRSCFARPVSFPGGWSQVRVGIRVLFTQLPTGLTASQIGTPLFGLGICHGQTNVLCTASTDHFVGMVTDGGWTSETGEVLYDFINLKGAVKVGTSTTLSAVISGAQSQFGQGTNAAWAPTPQMLFVDITKGSPNFTIASWYISNGQTAGLETGSDFLTYVVQSSPSKSGHTYTASPVTMAVDEAGNGTLNSVCASWNRIDFWPEITDMAFVVLS